MAEEKDQLVDEPTMEKMSVAPPEPQQDMPAGKGDGDTKSGVDDQDPLSAHPS